MPAVCDLLPPRRGLEGQQFSGGIHLSDCGGLLSDWKPNVPSLFLVVLCLPTAARNERICWHKAGMVFAGVTGRRKRAEQPSHTIVPV